MEVFGDSCGSGSAVELLVLVVVVDWCGPCSVNCCVALV